MPDVTDLDAEELSRQVMFHTTRLLTLVRARAPWEYVAHALGHYQRHTDEVTRRAQLLRPRAGIPEQTP